MLFLSQKTSSVFKFSLSSLHSLALAIIFLSQVAIHLKFLICFVQKQEIPRVEEYLTGPTKEMSGDFWSSRESGSAAINATNGTSLTCSAESLENPKNFSISPAYIESILKYYQMVNYLIVFFFGVFLNTFVLVLLLKFKKLRTLSFALALQIVFINLVNSLLFATDLISNIANQWFFGEFICVLVGFLHSLAYTIRIVLMLVFVIDRYLIIYLPFSYPKYRQKTVCTLSVIAWLLVFVISILMLPGLLDCYTYLPFGYGCNVSGRCSRACSILLNIITAVITIPSIIISTILYISLFWKAKKAKANIQASDVQNTFISEWKATITFSLMFLALFLLIFPFFLLLLVGAIIDTIFNLTRVLIIIAILLVNLVAYLVVMDPIFIMRNRDVRDVLSGCQNVLNDHETKTNLRTKYYTQSSYV